MNGGPEDDGPKYWEVMVVLGVFSIVVPIVVSLVNSFCKAWQ